MIIIYIQKSFVEVNKLISKKIEQARHKLQSDKFKATKTCYIIDLEITALLTLFSNRILFCDLHTYIKRLKNRRWL